MHAELESGPTASRSVQVLRLAMSRLAIVLALLAAAWPASAQTVVNPRLVEFVPSNDHATLLPDGQPAVGQYVLQVYQAGASTLLRTLSMGKPEPEGDGLIHYDFSGQLSGLTPGVTYEARVTAQGPGGESLSEPSNPFLFEVPASCTFSVAPTTISATASGGTPTVTLTTQADCQWTASSSASWVAPSPSSGSTSATVTLNVAANTGTSQRTGTVTVAGTAVTVTQAAAPCTYTVSPTTVSQGAAAGSATLTITAGTGCAWTAAAAASWLAVTPASGSGNGTVTLTIGANPGTSARTGTATVAGKTVTVNQAAAACTYTVSPATLSVVAAGGTGTVTVTAGTGCTWTATSGAGWITASPSSGSGNGTVTVTAAANTTTSTRSGTLTIAGTTVAVNQAAAAPSCSYTVDPIVVALPAAGGPALVTVSTTSGCAWTAASGASWLGVSPASGSGNATVTLNASANAGTSARTGTATVAGKTVTVDQAAATPTCSFVVSPSSVSAPYSGMTSSLSLTTQDGCAWTASSNASWLSLATKGGSGSRSIGFTVSKNQAAKARTATITVGGESVTVTQASRK